jgi:hypothetical protein
MTEPRPTTTARAWAAASQPAPSYVPSADATLASRAGDLAEPARLFRAAARHPKRGSDLALAFSRLEGVLDDLAAGAELAAYAVIESTRPLEAPVTSPTPRGARSISWRLHALRGRLIAARNTCEEVTRASRDAERESAIATT